jgi:uncharacterized membrane protein YecN with MAPEG domain
VNAASIVSIIAILGSLILVWRGMQGRQLPPGRRVQMAVAWLVIIVGLVFVLNILGIERAP